MQLCRCASYDIFPLPCRQKAKLTNTVVPGVQKQRTLPHSPATCRSVTRQPDTTSWPSFLGVITNLLVIVRLIFKRYYSYARQLGWDDYTIIGAMCIGIPATIINLVGLTVNGMGRDVWTLGTIKLNNFGMYFYIMEVLYLAEITFIKLSLSIFYLNIFPGEWTHRLLWGTVIFNIVSGSAFAITGILQCMPIPYFWYRYTDPSAKGTCLDINAFAWVHAAVSIAVDVWMIAIPLSQLPKLRLHWKKRIGVTIMFLIGTL